MLVFTQVAVIKIYTKYFIMIRIKSIILLIAVLVTISTLGQDTKVQYGLKTGPNYSKYIIPNFDIIEIKRKLGFYFGGFTKVKINNKIFFQPELLFGLQGTKFKGQHTVTTSLGVQLYIYELRTNEYTIILPLMLIYNISENFFF